MHGFGAERPEQGSENDERNGGSAPALTAHGLYPQIRLSFLVHVLSMPVARETINGAVILPVCEDVDLRAARST